MHTEMPSTETFSDGTAVVDAVRRGRRRFDDVVFIGCDLSDVSWTGVTVKRGRFVRCRFGDDTARICITEARFQQVSFEWCDFRRCTLDGCTFRRSEFEWCDFYRAGFNGGTTFEDAVFASCSLSRCDPSGSDLALSNLGREGDLQGIVQLSTSAFRIFHERFGHVDPEQQAEHVAEQRREAIEILRTLGGHFLWRGRFVDEGAVYCIRRSLEFEGARAQLARDRKLRALVDVAGLWLAKVTCGFGERLGRVVTTIGVIVLVVAAVLWATGGVRDDRGERASPQGAMLTAVLRVVGQSPANMTPANEWAELLLGLESLAVIGLVGLFGFILANRIRSR